MFLPPPPRPPGKFFPPLEKSLRTPMHSAQSISPTFYELLFNFRNLFWCTVFGENLPKYNYNN
jgi:hypothetical protein